MTRIAVLSDLHLGVGSTVEQVRELGARVVAAHPELVLITGDLFDRADSGDAALAAGQALLQQLSDGGRRVLVIGGNHDAESPLPARLALPRGVHWFGAEHAETLVLNRLGLAVHGLSVAARDDDRDPVRLYPQPVAGLLNLGLLHTSLDGRWSKRACLPTTVEQLCGMPGYDAWLLGHVHGHRVLATQPLVLYPGDSGCALLELPPGALASQWTVTRLELG